MRTLRSLARSPGFVCTALATLAICLGANLTIFAAVDAILLRPLPFRDSDRLVALFNAYPGLKSPRSGSSYANYFERRGEIPALASVALLREGHSVIGEQGSPDRVPIARVTPDFFSTLGVALARGRTFTEAELAFGPDEVAILTDDFWRNRFQSDPDIVGKTFLNDGQRIAIVGVLPPGFRFLSSRAQFFRPLAHLPQERAARERHNNVTQMIGRLAPGRTLAEAQAQVDALNARLEPTDPFLARTKGVGFRSQVAPLHADHVRDIRPTLLLLQCGVLFLLLIGAVNLANLFLIRASGRLKEVAVRRALGAGRWHIAREVLGETLLLSLGGGALGLLLGAFGIELLAALGTERLPLGATVAFDGRIAGMALAGAVALGLLLAAPAIWFNLRGLLAAGLQLESRGGTASRAAQRVRHAFIVAQVALAFVLLSGAGLVGLSLRRALEVPLGFRPDSVLSGRLSLAWKNHPDDAARLAFVERLLPAMRTLPGVTHAAIASDPPFTAGGVTGAVTVAGYRRGAGEPFHPHHLTAATSEYWTAMGIPLRRGRFLEDADNHRDERVCVVDEDFARRYWPDADPIGQRIAQGLTPQDADFATIVGVVGSVKQNELTEASGRGTVYFSYSVFNAGTFSLLVRASLPPAALAPAVRHAVLALEPELPIDDLRPLQGLIDDSLVARRSPAVLAGLFAGVALLLAALGTYGVLSYAVAQREREIGVRMALGALPGHICRQFLGLGLRLLALGLSLGVLGAWAAGRGMQTLLFAVPPLSLVPLAVTAAIMSAVSLVACWLPARRAACVDPMVALRAE